MRAPGRSGPYAPMSSSAMDGTIDRFMCDGSCGFECGNSVKGKRDGRDQHRPPVWDHDKWLKIDQKKRAIVWV